MGNSFSVNRQNINNDIAQTAISNCPQVQASSQVNIAGSTIGPSDFIAQQCLAYGQPLTFNINQSSTVDSNCAIQNIQQGINNAIPKLDAKTKAGLFGTAISANDQEVQQAIKNKIEQSCGDYDSKDIVNITNSDIRTCSSIITQNATAKSECELNAYQNAANKVTASLSSSTEGFLSGTTGIIVIILVICCVISIIAAAGYGYYAYNKKQTGTVKTTATKTEITKTGGNFGGNSWGIVIIGIVLLLLVFMFFSTKKSQPVTQTELNGLGKSIKNAHQIANVENSPSNYVSTPSDSPVNSPICEEVGQEVRGVEDECGLDDFYKPLI